jgi:hypothetical protein
LEDFHDGRMGDKGDESLKIKAMNSLHRREAEDKIADGTLVDNEDRFHRAEVNDVIWE